MTKLHTIPTKEKRPAYLAQACALALMRQTNAGHEVWRVLPTDALVKRQAQVVLEEAWKRLIATRNAAVSADMLVARDWDDLELRLSEKGFALSEGEEGLHLRDMLSGAPIGSLVELGLPIDGTIKRLGQYECRMSRLQSA